MTWFALHNHSRYSAMDGMGQVRETVRAAADYGHPAVGLTDHGSMAGAVELYNAAREFGIKPLPGIELYAAYGKKQRTTFHLVVAATSRQGYLNLVQLNNQCTRDFYYKPVLDLYDLDSLDTRGLVLTTACHFGLMQSAWRADRIAALNVVAALAERFDVYVEAQAHGIVVDGHDQDADNQIAALEVAHTLGLPVVLGADCHYPAFTDRPLHDAMKRLGSWSDDPDSAVFPGSYGYHMVPESVARRWYDPKVWEEGTAGLAAIASAADVVIDPLEKFDPVLITSGTDDARLRVRVLREAVARSLSPEHSARIEEELAVIEQFGFAGYLLLVAEITDYCRANGIAYNVRGSAAGSIVCWLLQVSGVDPLKWGLGFDRFLSRDRAKLPDVDIDVDSSKRDMVIDHLRRTYVVESICLYSELGIDREPETGKWSGSAVVKWHQAQSKKNGSHVLTETAAQVLRSVCGSGRVIASRGRHAAGLVVAPDTESMKWMPLAAIGSASDARDKVVTAFDMSSTEAMGYVKIDLLGLKALTAVTHCLSQVGLTLDDIPLDDSAVFTMISAGLTVGVFQLEGYAAKRGCQSMKPRSINQVIDAMALFRPAAIESGATKRYVRHLQAERAGKPIRSAAEKLHPDIVAVVTATRGEMLYQEQMIDVLKAVGLSPDEMGRALKAIKASNANTSSAAVTIAELMDRVGSMAQDKGWGKPSVRWLEDAFAAYAGYSFNRAHATSYGLLAYQTAWLLNHHPGPFLEGMILAHAGDSAKVDKYNQELTARGFKHMPVDVNTCGVSTRVDVDGMAVYPALTSVDKVGPVMARRIAAAAPFADLADFAVRARVSGMADYLKTSSLTDIGGAAGALRDAGALRSLPPFTGLFGEQ